jgi:hypothetical protein
MSEAEDPGRILRKESSHEVSVEDVRQLMGPSTPHFALQLRNRIANLIAGLPPGSPARADGETRGPAGEAAGRVLPPLESPHTPPRG